MWDFVLDVNLKTAVAALVGNSGQANYTAAKGGIMALMLIALGRYGQPEDVANAHLFLASEEADFVSGVRPTDGRRPARGLIAGEEYGCP